MAERARNKPLHVLLSEWEDERVRIKAQTLKLSLRELVIKAIDAYAPTADTNRMDSFEAQLGALTTRIDSLEIQMRSHRETLEKRVVSAESELHKRIDGLDPSSKVSHPSAGIIPSYLKSKT